MLPLEPDRPSRPAEPCLACGSHTRYTQAFDFPMRRTGTLSALVFQARPVKHKPFRSPSLSLPWSPTFLLKTSAALSQDKPSPQPVPSFLLGFHSSGPSLAGRPPLLFPIQLPRDARILIDRRALLSPVFLLAFPNHSYFSSLASPPLYILSAETCIWGKGLLDKQVGWG